MSEPNPNGGLSFEIDVLPHLDAAYNLARWLTRNEQDAQDVLQEASLRAFRFLKGVRGGNTKAWLLKIVRNVSYTRLERNRTQRTTAEFDETVLPCADPAFNPEESFLWSEYGEKLRFALESLPPMHREVLILRELEGMSYKEISQVTSCAAGTVMSRLSRARGELRISLADIAPQEDPERHAVGRPGHTRLPRRQSSSQGES